MLIMNKYKLLLILCFAVFSNFSSAEIYKNFLPSDSLALIKTKYPNAKLEDTKAAWVKEDESFIKLTGVGIAGSIFLKFSTSDTLYKQLIKFDQDIIDKNPTSENFLPINDIKRNNDLLTLPLDQRLTLDWVRWAPPDPIPLVRLVSKYGNPEKFDFDPETFQPFCSWPRKGVIANLSDDKKIVYSIEYYFTSEELGISKPLQAQPSEPEVKEKLVKKNKVKQLQQ